MLFNSIEFLIFFPIVVLIYFLIPHKVKYIWLLVSSYYFYMSWNPRYALLMAASTIVTWGSGLLLQNCMRKYGKQSALFKRWCLAGCIVFNMGILFFFKYYGFASESIEVLMGELGVPMKIPQFDILLPVGISFYTFQALGYVIDVYRGEIEAERNLLRYAVFISFFPQLVAGPIERSKNLMRQMHEIHYFEEERVKNGFLLMGWGFFEKLVIADRIAPIVTDIYSNYTQYTGIQIVAATILFAFQIYCDFAGYSDIAIGAAQVLGFELTKNFKSPYYSTSVSEFWRNWHISLTTWFRDYVYIPLGGNRCAKWKKYRNLLITFSLSGLWHGAAWHYVVWGSLNGVYLVLGDATRSLRRAIWGILKINTGNKGFQLLQGIVTFLFVDIGFLFFRADSLGAAFHMIGHGLQTKGILDAQTIEMMKAWGGVDLYAALSEWLVLILGLITLFVVDYYRRKISLKTVLARKNIWVRYLAYYALIFSILIFGVYGSEYDTATFIYFQF